MKSRDVLNKAREENRAAIMQAIRDNDEQAFVAAMDTLCEQLGDQIKAEYEDLRSETDTKILAQRGVRQLTSDEIKFYKGLAEATKAKDPKQALTNLDVTMPITVIDAVFDELENSHPLLSMIDFRQSTAAYRVLYAQNGEQRAQWGELCDEIVKELLAGFDAADGMLLKLSAFIPVCKAALALGPEWLDRFVRQVLVEALHNGLEYGFVAGDGNESPIGMNRQVGPNVTVTGGVYPLKEVVKVNSFDAATYGKLVALLATDASGKARRIEGNVMLLVNPQDYYSKILPAMSVMAPDGTYRRDVFPVPTTVVQTSALGVGEAIIGLPYRYLALVGIGQGTDGTIEYSDHYRFLEDYRVYIVKAYANGRPKDNNAFLRLDISDLRELVYKMQMVEAPEASANANLAALRLGAAALSPAFAANTTTYTASTTNATNTINAIPADAAATVEIRVGGNPVANGSAIQWAAGANTVTITVTAEDGTTEKTYTVTVTKS